MSEANKDTRALVFEAAYQMLREGHGSDISQRTIYERIGNYGSMKTINNGLAEWYQEAGNYLCKLEYMDGLSTLVAPLAEAFDTIRQAAEVTAKKEHEAATQDAEAKIKAAEEARDATLEAKVVADTKATALQHQVEQLIEKVDGLNRQWQSEKDRREATEKQITDIRRDAQDRIDQANQRSQELETSLTKEEGRHQATEERLTALYDQERVGCKSDKADADTTITELRRKCDDLAHTLHNVESEKAKLSGRLDHSQGEIQRLEAAGVDLNARIANMLAEMANVKARHDQDRAKLDQAEARLRQLQAHLNKRGIHKMDENTAYRITYMGIGGMDERQRLIGDRAALVEAINMIEGGGGQMVAVCLEDDENSVIYASGGFVVESD